MYNLTEASDRELAATINAEGFTGVSPTHGFVDDTPTGVLAASARVAEYAQRWTAIATAATQIDPHAAATQRAAIQARDHLEALRARAEADLSGMRIRAQAEEDDQLLAELEGPPMFPQEMPAHIEADLPQQDEKVWEVAPHGHESRASLQIQLERYEDSRRAYIRSFESTKKILERDTTSLNAMPEPASFKELLNLDHPFWDSGATLDNVYAHLSALRAHLNHSVKNAQQDLRVIENRIDSATSTIRGLNQKLQTVDQQQIRWTRSSAMKALSTVPNVEPRSVILGTDDHGTYVSWRFDKLTMTPDKNTYPWINEGAQNIKIPLPGMRVSVWPTSGKVTVTLARGHKGCINPWGRNQAAPHILADDRPCLGSFEQAMAECFESGDIAIMAHTMREFLSQASNEDGAGKHWPKWIARLTGAPYLGENVVDRSARNRTQPDGRVFSDIQLWKGRSFTVADNGEVSWEPAIILRGFNVTTNHWESITKEDFCYAYNAPDYFIDTEDLCGGKPLREAKVLTMARGQNPWNL